MTLNRIIKFRAWDTEQKHMIVVNQSLGLHSIFGTDLNNRSNWILLQYTGLTDTNEKEIYEGDVVKGKTITGVVEYYLDGFRISSPPIAEDLGEWGISEREVLGNIYENPEESIQWINNQVKYNF